MRIMSAIGLAAALWVAACQSNTYQLKGTADGVPDGQTVYLTDNPGTLMPIDSAIISDGHFRFEGQTDATRAATVYTRQDSLLSIDILLTPGSASVVLSATAGHSRISGSTIHDEWQAMNDQLALYGDTLRQLASYKGQLTDSGHIALLTEARRIERQMKACILTTAQRNSQNELGRFITTHFTDSL